MEVREYLTEDGRSPFARWFNKLDARAAVRVTIALNRMEQGTCRTAKAWVAFLNTNLFTDLVIESITVVMEIC